MRNFFIKTFGCAANKVDSEVMVKILKERGYKLTCLDKADYIIVNTCGVKKPTEDRVIHVLKRFSKLNKKLIIAGCLPKINLKRIKKEVPSFTAMLDPQSIHKIAEIFHRIERGEKQFLYFSKTSADKAKLSRRTFNSVIGIIQISEGCNLACSYCCTRFARGRLNCFPVESIINTVKEYINNGCKEIQITSQDNASYNYNGKNLPELLNKLCSIKGKFFIRVGMMNPIHVKPILDELIEAYRSEKIFKFLHLPVQSGSPGVLKLMNRGYSVEDFLKIVKKFKKEFPWLTLATDVIVGFPSETESDFEKTVKLIKKVKPDIVNISKFGVRPETKAAKMKQLPSKIIKERSTKLSKLVKDIQFKENKKWLGWEGEVLIDEKGKGKTFIGRNFAYKPVVIYSNESLLGKFVNVKIIDVKTTYLIGEVI